MAVRSVRSVSQAELAARSELVAKYFLPEPSRPSIVAETVTVAAGSICVALGYSLLASPGLGNRADGPAALVLLAGLVAVVATVLHTVGKLLRHRAALNRSRPKATGAQLDGWLAEAIGQAVASADRGEPQGEPLVFVGIPDLVTFPWNQVAAGAHDQILRFSLYEILVVHVLEHRLISFAEVHDMRTGARRSPVITEFPLAGVDSVRTVVTDVGRAGGGTALGQAVDRTAFAATSEVSRVRQLQLLSQGRVVVELAVGVATRKRGEPEDIFDSRRPDEAVLALNALLGSAQLDGGRLTDAR